MDATALGTLLLGVGTVVGAAVAYLGKRQETTLSGLSTLTDQLQEERADIRRERDDYRQQVIERDTRLAEQAALRAADQAELARLRAERQQRGEGET